MRKIALLFILGLALIIVPICKTANAEDEKYVRVIFTVIDVFDSPNASGEANVVGNANYGEKLQLISNAIQIGDDGLNYYNILFLNDNAFVLASEVTPNENVSPKKQLDTNATLAQDAIVYKKNGDEYTETQTTLKSETKIKVLDGIDYSRVYTRIQYQDENNDTFVGYIKTITIKKSGISRTTIGAICIIVATVSIVLVSFGIKARLKKKIRRK